MIRRLILTIGALLLALAGSVAAQDDLVAFEMQWSPDGRWLGVGSNDGVWIFVTDDFGADPYHYSAGNYISTVTFDPLHPYAAYAAPQSETVRIVEIETGNEVLYSSAAAGTDEYSGVFYDLGYSSDGRYLAVANGAMLHVLDAATGASVLSEGEPGDWNGVITDLEFTNQDTSVAISNWRGDLAIYPIHQPENVQRYSFGLSNAIYHFRTIPGTRHVLLLHNHTVFEALAFSSRQELTPLNNLDEYPVLGFGLHPEKDLVALGGENKWSLYDLNEGGIVETFAVDAPDDDVLVYSLAFNPEGTQVATLQSDGKLYVWDIATGEIIATLDNFSDGLSPFWG